MGGGKTLTWGVRRTPALAGTRGMPAMVGKHRPFIIHTYAGTEPIGLRSQSPANCKNHRCKVAKVRLYSRQRSTNPELCSVLTGIWGDRP